MNRVGSTPRNPDKGDKRSVSKFQGLILREKTKWWKAPKGGGAHDGPHVRSIQTFNSCNGYSIHNCKDYPGEEHVARTKHRGLCIVQLAT